MRFYIYDVQKGKGYWQRDYSGYTHDFTQAGLYEASELPTHAGDCWIAIPEFIPYHNNPNEVGAPNTKLVNYLKGFFQ